jgi:medium-chain acyl-[acyl-carrier-protein] hydrolase
VTRWLLRFPPRPAAPLRLVCVPGAGSSPSMFHGWTDSLPDEVEVCAVQAPGRGARFRQEPFTRMALLADALAQAVVEDSDRPVVLFGHSLGALIAFEVATRLVRSPRAPAVALVVAAHRAPALGSAGLALHLLPEDELVRAAVDLGGTPGDTLANPGIRRMALPALRADFALDYHYQPPDPATLPIPISVFGGDADPIVSTADLEAWRVHATGDFRVRVLPGGHFFLVEQSGADLLDDLSAVLLDHVKRLQPTREGKPARVRG